MQLPYRYRSRPLWLIRKQCSATPRFCYFWVHLAVLTRMKTKSVPKGGDQRARNVTDSITWSTWVGLIGPHFVFFTFARSRFHFSSVPQLSWKVRLCEEHPNPSKGPCCCVMKIEKNLPIYEVAGVQFGSIKEVREPHTAMFLVILCRNSCLQGQNSNMSEVDSIHSINVEKVRAIIEVNELELAPVRDKLRLGAVLVALYVSIHNSNCALFWSFDHTYYFDIDLLICIFGFA